MSLFKIVRNRLQEPRLKGIDLNSDQLLVVHNNILYQKPMMRAVFEGIYRTCVALDKKYFAQNHAPRIEIGAGVSFFKKIDPDVMVSDIKTGAGLDTIVDAQHMPFDANSLQAVYGINCFHHFSNPHLFFKELERVLQCGGGCILIEPYYGFVAKRFYKHLFDTETFDPKQKGWATPSSGIMTGANQALSYIVFVRDQEFFKTAYPGLEIVLQKPLNNYVRYFFSGGLNFRQLLPYFFSPVLRLVEVLLMPFNTFFALHHIIVIRKKA